MSKTTKHRIEGLYRNGMIDVEDVPRSVRNSWDRHNSKNYNGATSGYGKKHKRDKEIRLDGFIDAFKEIEFERTYKGLDEK